MRKSEHTARRLEHIEAVVREAGVKLTHQRLEIFRELASTQDHPDAEAVFRAVKRRMPTVSLDTVYRTLWMLRDLGLVTTVGAHGDSVRFDVNLEQHHHYMCVRCGAIRDFESAALDALHVPDNVKELGSVLHAQVEVRGICARCQRASAPAKAQNQSTTRTGSSLPTKRGAGS